MKEIVIIGGGIAGLCTGIRLLHNGFHVTIYEKCCHTGGSAGHLSYQKSDVLYSCDSFSSIPVHPQEYKTVFTECGLNPEAYYQTIPLTDLYQLFLENGAAYTLSTHYMLNPESFENFFGESVSGYEQFIQNYYSKYQILTNEFMEQPLFHLSDLFHQKNTHIMKQLNPLPKASDSLSNYIKSPVLKKFILFQTLYMGFSPYKMSNLYLTIPACIQKMGLGQIIGGTGAYVKGLETAFLACGGILKTNSMVEKILFEGSKACGIMTDNKVIKADAICCCCDYTSIFSILPTNIHLSRRFRPKQSKNQMSYSVFMLRLVFPEVLKNFSVHNIYLNDCFRTECKRLEHHLLPQNPPLYLYYPAAVDSSFQKNGFTSMNIMMRVPNLSARIVWDNHTIFLLRNICLNALENMAGSAIRGKIVGEFYSTPLDLKNSFVYHQGGAFGFAPTLTQSLCFRPQVKKKGVDNLYFAGNSIHPGSGISIVMKGARNAAEQISNELL